MIDTDILLSEIVEPGARMSRPAGAYASFCRENNLVYSSGVVARDNGVVVDRLITEDTIKESQKAVRLATSAILLGLQHEMESLKYVERVVALNGYLRTDSHFTNHAKVMDAASAMIAQLFPSKPAPARTSIGVSTLPGGGVVEISMVFRVR